MTVPRISKRVYMFWAILLPIIRAHNCTLSFRYCQPILLQAGIVDDDGTAFHLIQDTNLQQYWLTISEAEYTVMCS